MRLRSDRADVSPEGAALTRWSASRSSGTSIGASSLNLPLRKSGFASEKVCATPATVGGSLESSAA
ncbi:Uncharacterised protein [Mycobacteroides abscessus subsp. abscessus]|nr:Uncharacterised protein [Mycobacteroides abscessus subsp. abscessus]